MLEMSPIKRLCLEEHCTGAMYPNMWLSQEDGAATRVKEKVATVLDRKGRALCAQQFHSLAIDWKREALRSL